MFQTEQHRNDEETDDMSPDCSLLEVIIIITALKDTMRER